MRVAEFLVLNGFVSGEMSKFEEKNGMVEKWKTSLVEQADENAARTLSRFFKTVQESMARVIAFSV